ETNSYGSAVSLRFGTDPGAIDHLFQYMNFLSINNQPSEVIGDYDWSVLARLNVDGNTGRSSVQRGGLLQVDFFQRLSAGGDSDQLVDWFFTVTFTNLTARTMRLCYYPYLDYDLWGSRYDDTARYSGVDLDLGVPSMRVQKEGIPGTFLLADLD